MFCSVALIVPALFIKSYFRLAALSLSRTPSSYFLSPSLPFGSTRCPGFILSVPCPCPRIHHLSKRPGSLNWIMTLETSIWLLGVLIATGMTLVSGRLCEHSQETHGYTHFPSRHRNFYIYFCPSVTILS